MRERSFTVDQAQAALRADGIQNPTIDRTIAYVRANPDVWLHFERFALAAIEAKRRIGAKLTFDRVRWEVEFNTGEEVRTNANLPYYFARMFEAKYPEHKTYFKRKKGKS